jgi:hypothetical protein
MKSEVDFTLGLSCSIVATGTPVFVEMTPNVSPACTVQNRGPGPVVVVVVCRRLVVVVVATLFDGVVGTATVVACPGVPARRPDRISKTAIVAARRNTAGAT